MTTGKTIALTRWTFVDKVMSLLFNMLSKLVITFLPRSKRLLISWLQSPSAVILEHPPPKFIEYRCRFSCLSGIAKVSICCLKNFQADVKKRSSNKVSILVQLSHKWKSRKGLEKNMPISDSPTSVCGPLAVPTQGVCRVLCTLQNWTQPALGLSSQWSMEMSSWLPFPFKSPLICCPNCPQALFSGEIYVDLRTSAHSLEFLLVLIQISLF